MKGKSLGASGRPAVIPRTTFPRCALWLNDLHPPTLACTKTGLFAGQPNLKANGHDAPTLELPHVPAILTRGTTGMAALRAVHRGECVPKPELGIEGNVLAQKLGNLLDFTEHAESTEYLQSVQYWPNSVRDSMLHRVESSQSPD